MTVLSWRLEENVAIVTLNRPPANAIASSVIKELAETFTEIEARSEAKVVVLHGKGRFFSAGADIKELTTLQEDRGVKGLAKEGQDVFNRIENFKKPVIAAIHGAALGGGLELALACHIRIASDNAKLGLPEMQLGLIPGFAGTQRLSLRIGTPRATEMVMIGDPISGKMAYEWGLVNRVVSEEQLIDEAMNLANKIAEKSAISLSYGLECLSYARLGRFEEGMKIEAEHFGDIFNTHDAKEGIQAFIEKRSPEFKDH
ncbi:enoyl-CoA hydratase [Tuberibacillus sp. Marseille-P3662]|uniref:enoyl-CoA hydratase n=1 Tax=Tuberibacillus sp. Marseille-P3662 TaxID=1965358 RepID=UPI000A1CE88E|nr:enoyl-CoA hydratase [Tuberibacillus sp. Marseille-P3662]